jgi:hypothetical protein
MRDCGSIFGVAVARQNACKPPTGWQTFDIACLRDELQRRRAFRHTFQQSVRAGLCRDARNYRHTRVYIELERGVKRALELNAFMEGAPYKRYEH